MTAMKHGTAVRLMTSSGETMAMPETRIVTPASGDIVRPRAPSGMRGPPRPGMVMPEGFGVRGHGFVEGLGGRVAGTGDDAHDPRTDGAAPTGEFIGILQGGDGGVDEAVARRPAANTPAAMMMPMTSA